MDLTVDLVLEGFAHPPPTYNFGIIVSRAGDVNDDGYDDLIVGQLSDSFGGWVYIFLGHPWMDNEPSIEWYDFYDYPGTSITDPGDVNGDGIDDIMFGAYHHHSNTRGFVDIYLGDDAFVVDVPEEIPPQVPVEFSLLPPYPNPFNNTVTIPFEIFPGINGDVSLIVYNVLGQLVADLRSEVHQAIANQESAPYAVMWDGKDVYEKNVSSGVYIVNLQWGVHRQLRKVVLLR